MSRQPNPDHLEQGVSDLQSAMLGLSRGFGLVLTVVGSVILWPALVHYAGLAMAGPTVDARIAARYYEMSPRLAKVPVAERITREVLGDIEWIYDITGSAVLEYEDSDGITRRYLFRSTTHVTGFYGQIDNLVPQMAIETRFPVGELDILRRTPPGRQQSGEPPRPWMTSAYDRMLLKVEDPAEHLVRTWTGPSGASVKLDTSTFPGGRPTLHSIGRDGHALLAMPLLIAGLMLTFAGLRFALMFARAPRESAASELRPSALWIVLVLSSPLWAQAFPSTLKLFGASWAGEMVGLMRDAPHMWLSMFDIPVAETPDDQPYEALRFPSPDSVYAPLWTRLALERPAGCCDNREAVFQAARLQVAARLDAMDEASLAAFMAGIDALHAAGHWNLDDIVLSAVEEHRSRLHGEADIPSD